MVVDPIFTLQLLLHALTGEPIQKLLPVFVQYKRIRILHSIFVKGCKHMGIVSNELFCISVVCKTQNLILPGIEFDPVDGNILR